MSDHDVYVSLDISKDSEEEKKSKYHKTTEVRTDVWRQFYSTGTVTAATTTTTQSTN
jgi:hypothetical protein